MDVMKEELNRSVLPQKEIQTHFKSFTVFLLVDVATATRSPSSTM